ncbi:MAG TPA: hypothetical protein VEB20_16515 [Azospirillaceae bacterium]|nr:hypothetical protein [Azospirillaceae bacterium]
MAFRSDDSSAQLLARGLGWFSIGLGLAELMGGGRMSRSLGMGDHPTLLRAYGLREIATGIGILAQRDPTPWIWGRVGGDLLDLATLAGAMDRDNRGRIGGAIGAVAGVTVLDVLCGQALARQGNGGQRRGGRYEGGRPGRRARTGMAPV